MTHRFKGLDLIECLKNYWMEVCNILQEVVIKTISKGKKKRDAKKAKWMSQEASQIAEKRRKGKIYPSGCRVPKNSKER